MYQPTDLKKGTVCQIDGKPYRVIEYGQKVNQSSLQLAFAEKTPNVQKVDISIISSNEEQTCVLIICHNTES